MIDSNKLLPDRGTTITLSKGSVKKVALIERKLLLIDSLLKEKLILSKVREGIRRQEEERIKRTQQEIDLEKDDDDDMDDPDEEAKKRKKPKDPKGGGSVALVGSALIGAAGVTLARNAGIIIAAAQVATVLIKGGLSVGIGITKISKQFGKLKTAAASFGVEGAAATAVANQFLFLFKNFVSAAILVSIFNSVPASRFKIRERLAKRIRQIGKKKVATNVIDDVVQDPIPDFAKKIKREIKIKERVNPKIRTQKTLFTRGRERRKPLTGGELKTEIRKIRAPKPKPKVAIDIFGERFDPNKVNRLNPRYSSFFGRTVDPELESMDEGFKNLRFNAEISQANAMKELELSFNKRKSIQFEYFEEKLIDKETYEIRMEQIDREIAGRQNNVFKRNKELDELNEKARATEIVDDQGNKIKVDKKGRFSKKGEVKVTFGQGVDRRSSGGGFSQNTKFNRIFEAPLDDFGFGGGNTISGPSFFNQRPTPLTSRQILSQQGTFTAPKIVNQVTKNADNLTNVKSLSKLLEAFGGIPLVKATRKIFDNTLGRIPLLGDLLGILLDIFVFKEPVGRAVFMAAGGSLGGTIGAWLGGILGTAVPVVGNLAGAVVGGFLGGVGGDMLGGFLYDQIVGKQQKPQPLTEKAIKSTTKLALNGGGLVPSLAMQGGGMTPDVGSFASYENPRGRVAVRTVLLPINSESSETSDATVIATSSKRRSSNYDSLYKGGLA